MWILQGRPDRIDMTLELEVGQTIPWLASRYQKSMKIGDTVLMWQSGNAEFRGIHAIGKIVKEAYKSSEGYTLIDVEIVSTLTKPLLATSLKKDDALNNLQILKAPIGTNFKVNQTEGQAISMMLGGAPNDEFGDL